MHYNHVAESPSKTNESQSYQMEETISCRNHLPDLLQNNSFRQFIFSTIFVYFIHIFKY